MTQQQIAEKLGCDQVTISRDRKALNNLARSFIFNLARSDLGLFYKGCLDGIEEAKKECWRIYAEYSQAPSLDNARYRILALDTAIKAEKERFRLLSEGPSVLALQGMNQRLDQIEQGYNDQRHEQR
jgi:hypothetical protein